MSVKEGARQEGESAKEPFRAFFALNESLSDARSSLYSLVGLKVVGECVRRLKGRADRFPSLDAPACPGGRSRISWGR